MNRKILLTLIILLIIIAVPLNTFATTTDTNEFTNLTMEISIDEDATATIVETWEVSIYDGTEMYKPYYNLDVSDSEIENFSVTDEKGTEYEFLSDWDIDASQDDKSEKCGIYEDTEYNSTELCWGIGEYGTHTYTISYQITNFVSFYSEDEIQKTSFNLVPNNMDPTPKKVDITISSTFDFTEDNITVTANGFTGSTNIEDGIIKISTTSSMSSSQYVDLLIEYENEPFNVSNTISYDDYDEWYEEQQPSFWQRYGKTIFWIIVVVVIIVVIVIINRNRNNKNRNNGNGDYIEVQ